MDMNYMLASLEKKLVTVKNVVKYDLIFINESGEKSRERKSDFCMNFKKLLKCPKCGRQIHKKQNGKMLIAKKCPDGSYGLGICSEYKRCRFNHNVANCYWCNSCKKHYQIKDDKEKVMFT